MVQLENTNGGSLLGSSRAGTELDDGGIEGGQGGWKAGSSGSSEGLFEVAGMLEDRHGIHQPAMKPYLSTGPRSAAG